MNEKPIYRANNTLFYNSQCIFVEYMDIIKMPWFVLAGVCRQNDKLKSILNLDIIEDLPLNSLFEWYLNRRNRNIFYELAYDKSIDLSLVDNIVNSQLEITPIFFDTDTEGTIVPALKKILREGIVKEVVIYSEVYNHFMEADIKHLFSGNKKVVYKHGDFKTILQSIPVDTTYFFSDIEKVVTLDDADHLEFSSITIPYDYQYNKNEKYEWNVNFEYLGTKKIFKLSFYNAFLVPNEKSAKS